VVLDPVGCHNVMEDDWNFHFGGCLQTRIRYGPHVEEAGVGKVIAIRIEGLRGVV